MIDTLRQGVALLRNLSEEQYIQSVPEAFHSCIGSHYRHGLEHFEALLLSEQPEWIDYDARKRDAKVETDPSAALERTKVLLERAEQIEPGSMDRPVRVRCGVGAETESPVVSSTLGREVMYAVIHAVHHYAIIRMMCNLMDIPQAEDFGVASSTLRYRKQVSPHG